MSGDVTGKAALQLGSEFLVVPGTYTALITKLS